MATILVPTDAPNIQAAVNMAAPSGDTILLEEGIFTGANNRNIDPGGKDIIFEGETGDPADIVIDCQNVANTRGFNFQNGETTACIIKNLSIINGNHTQGGGIRCLSNSHPTIENCIIRNNSGGGINGGGGIYCDSSNPTITNCVIRNNWGVSYGGGICCWSAASPVITNCIIRNNTCGTMGGGIYCRNNSDSTINNSTITGNSTKWGGGICCNTNCDITMTDSIIWGNVSTQNGGHQIYISAVTDTLTLNYCCYGNGANDVFNGGTFNTNNCITADPLFVAGPDGNYCLSQIAAGEGADSPALNAGSDTAAALGMNIYTTRSDQVIDEQQVDMGWYYLESYSWNPIQTVPHDDTVWAYSLLSPRLDDLSDAEFRVVPVDKAGNDGTPLALSAERIVRTPDAPDFTATFDPGTTKVTFAAV